MPPILGALIDRSAGTAPWCALGGLILGFGVGMAHLLQIARQTPKPDLSRIRPLTDDADRGPGDDETRPRTESTDPGE